MLIPQRAMFQKADMNDIVTQIFQSFTVQSMRETIGEVKTWVKPMLSSPLVQEICESFTPASMRETWKELISLLPRKRKEQPVLSNVYANHFVWAWASIPKSHTQIERITAWIRDKKTWTRFWIATHRRGVDEGIASVWSWLVDVRQPAVRFVGNAMVVSSIAWILLLSAPFLALELRTAVFKLTQPLVTDAQPNQKPIALPEDITPEPDRQFRVRIPLIGVEANVTPNVDVNNPGAYEEALQHGLAHAKGTGFPDSDGGVNKSIFIFSHSTNGSWNITRYNALFYSLKDLEVDSQIQVWFWGKEYWYKVTEKRVVQSDDVSFLEPQMEKEKLILQTCWPPGTLDKRMIVTAERIEQAQ